MLDLRGGVVGGVVVGGVGFCDFKAQPALAAMVMGWLWGRPEQLKPQLRYYTVLNLGKSIS